MDIREQIIADITAKVETKLASQKVELSAIDDLKNEISKIKYLNADVNSMNTNAEKTSKLFIDALKQKEVLSKNYADYKALNKSIYGQLNTIFKAINTQAKELGVNINDLPVYKEYLDSKNLLDQLSDKTQSAWDLVNKY